MVWFSSGVSSFCFTLWLIQRWDGVIEVTLFYQDLSDLSVPLVIALWTWEPLHLAPGCLLLFMSCSLDYYIVVFLLCSYFGLKFSSDSRIVTLLILALLLLIDWLLFTNFQSVPAHCFLEVVCGWICYFSLVKIMYMCFFVGVARGDQGCQVSADSYRWLWIIQHGLWEPNVGPLEEQYLLLILKPSLQPLELVFKNIQLVGTFYFYFIFW